jgi:hypothetical protein
VLYIKRFIVVINFGLLVSYSVRYLPTSLMFASKASTFPLNRIPRGTSLKYYTRLAVTESEKTPAYYGPNLITAVIGYIIDVPAKRDCCEGAE